MKNLEYKSVGFEVSEYKADAETGRMAIKGYASVFGNVDSYGDIVASGAFSDTLKAEGSRVQFCYQHDMRSVIGVISALTEDARGLYIEADILPTTLGKDVQVLVDGGALKELSIGYRTIESEKMEMDGKEIRTITALKLYEVSIVSRAANEAAIVTGAQKKSEEEVFNLKEMTDTALAELKAQVNEEFNMRIINNLNN